MTPVDRSAVVADGAPAAIGPYSHAIKSGGFLFCSGALAIDPASGEAVTESPAAETGLCLKNLAAVCAAAGAELTDAVRLTVFTTDLSAFAEINEAYADFFPGDPPARVAIGVAELPKGLRVEIDAIVAVG